MHNEGDAVRGVSTILKGLHQWDSPIVILKANYLSKLLSSFGLS